MKDAIKKLLLDLPTIQFFFKNSISMTDVVANNSFAVGILHWETFEDIEPNTSSFFS